MKRFGVWALLLVTSLGTLEGCYGRFALVRNVYEMNSRGHDKYMRSLLTLILLPVYAISGLVDLIMFNTIEFWSGSNPVAEAEKTFRYAEAGQSFDIHASKRGDIVTYTIDRSVGDRHADSMVITCNTVNGEARVVRNDAAGTTSYLVRMEGDRPVLAQLSPRLYDGGRMLVSSR